MSVHLFIVIIVVEAKAPVLLMPFRSTATRVPSEVTPILKVR